jgi:Zn-dependent protease with chaperone function
MSKRLQVLLDEAELAEIRKTARRQRLTTAAWVRQALRAARRAEPAADAKKKLAVVRAATLNAFPTADIDAMLVEIERGYLGGAR